MSNIDTEPVQIKNIREGDIFVDPKANRAVWKALGDVSQTNEGEFVLRVQHCADGGIDHRLWTKDSGDLHLNIRREVAAL